MNIISLQYYGDSGYKVQDDVIITIHIVSHNMWVDTKVQNQKTILIDEGYNG